MYTQDKRDNPQTLIHAVETLSNIAELEIDHPIAISEKQELVIQETPLSVHTIHWFHRGDADDTINLVKETFKTILKYLQNFYEKDYPKVIDPEMVEGIKTIMVLVGEAAKKLDKHIQSFPEQNHRAISELREYKALQEFYFRKVASKIDEGLLGKWILALTHHQGFGKQRKISTIDHRTKEAKQADRVIIDLEAVKKDSEYEFFYMRKEDGTRFFSPRLVRNIKLICDFGEYYDDQHERDPLFDLEEWQQRYIHSIGSSLLNGLRPQIDQYYSYACRYKDNELITIVGKALIALMMSSHSQSAQSNWGKRNIQYFSDFLQFLREAVNFPSYQKMLAYPPRKGNKTSECLVALISGLCQALYASERTLQAIAPMTNNLVEEARHLMARKAAKKELYNSEDCPAKSLTDLLHADYAGLKVLLKRHRGGPLNKVLEALHQGTQHAYDPLLLHNFPCKLFSFDINNRKVTLLRLPSPTYQEMVNRVSIVNEFKGFLHRCDKGFKINKLLIINMQDRTSWREHPRCIAIEDLQKHTDFSKHLVVVTLNKDGDFYHQCHEYAHEGHAKIFLQQMREHIIDESFGYFFPEKIKYLLSETFIDPCLSAIHEQFFSEKNVLPHQSRMDFIEIFYMFLQLKLLEITEADSFSLTCKDCIDIGASASAQLLLFLRLIKAEGISEEEIEEVNSLLYSPSILLRERLIFPERFNRMQYALKVIETTIRTFGGKKFRETFDKLFGPLYKETLLNAHLFAP